MTYSRSMIGCLKSKPAKVYRTLTNLQRKTMQNKPPKKWMQSHKVSTSQQKGFKNEYCTKNNPRIHIIEVYSSRVPPKDNTARLLLNDSCYTEHITTAFFFKKVTLIFAGHHIFSFTPKECPETVNAKWKVIVVKFTGIPIVRSKGSFGQVN